MNKLILIGNGFDLAHGLKTRYSDFLLWYVNKTVRLVNTSNSNIFEDGLIVLDNEGYHVNEFESLESFKDNLNKRRISFHCKNTFFDRILRQSTDSNWVDIEYEYYLELLSIYKKIEKHNMGKNEGAEKIVKEVNICLDLIKKQLIEYLQTLEIATYSEEIKIRFNKELKNKSFSEVLFLVFNYTKTIELYMNSLEVKNGQIIYIHGQLSDDENPIIFGYGDEMDEYYSKIESLNLNEFLRNMKSFSYLKTRNYQNLNRFLNKDPYILSIMGHSCGISDRVLLNSIFCHQNCSRIRIYFYQKDKNENDYFEKTQEISRHFALDRKNKMRNMIVPLSDSISLA
jgi:hypothetical protein